MAAAALRITRATRRDVPTLLAFIRGLARYERLSRECRATAARVRHDAFGPRRYFEALVCRRGRRAIGFAVYYFTYSTFRAAPTLYIEDLFVRPQERGRGVGRALLVALARLALRRRCASMEWTVLDWNAPAIRFYRVLGAQLRREWILTRLTGAPLQRLARASTPDGGAARRRSRGSRQGARAARPRTSRPAGR